MALGTPSSSTEVENRIKADVQREAPDSNPYSKVNWLNSFIVGVGRRQFDIYRDLNRTELRLFPDTADEETAPIWGNIYIGPQNAATISTGQLVATGTAGGVVGIGVTLTASGSTYTTTTADTITLKSLSVSSLTRSGQTVTAITDSIHGLSSFVPVTITGAVETEYNVVDSEIIVNGLNSFTYQVEGSPTTPATGVILAGFTTANIEVDSDDFGDEANLDTDTPLALQAPIANVDNTLYVTFASIGGGTDEETTPEYKSRYLDKIRNPVAHFNVADIEAKAKTVTGVTRVFVEPAGSEVGSVFVTSITRNGNVATAITTTPHGFDDGQTTTITGAAPAEYNVINERIIVESANVFHYVVPGQPITPATGGMSAATSIPLGQVRVFFTRDNDPTPIPNVAEVQAVKDSLDEILPANTSTADLIVSAPAAVPINHVFTNLIPSTTTMRAAVEANLAQFYEERPVVGVNVDEDAYRAAIANTVDPDTGDVVQSFDLSTPIGDIPIDSGQLAILGTVQI
jgi:uncharacterized phage protein gp47/JayE